MTLNIKIKVEKEFKDIYDVSIEHKPGEIFETTDEERTKNIVGQKLGKVLEIKGNYKNRKDSKKIVVYTSRVFTIGGIETAIYNIAKTFSDYDLTFIFGEGDIEQMLRVAQYRPVKIDDGSDIDCDVLIVMGYDGLKRIKGKIIAGKIYHQIHADWSVLKEKGLYKDYQIETNGIDKFLAVSETAKKGLKKAFGLESVVVPNILAKQDYGEFRIFLTLSRLEAEKGGNILLRMLERFRTANKHFVWIICGGGSEQSKVIKALSANKNVILLPPAIENEWLLPKVDYLVQTSLTESYCYSIHQALAVGTPVISTRIPEAEKVIRNGENGYLVNFDLSDLDIDKVFEKRPEFKATSEKVEPVWGKVLDGEL